MTISYRDTFANPTSVTLTEVLCTNLPNMGIYLSVRVTSVPSEWRHFSLGRPQDWPRCNVGFGVCLRGLTCMTSTKLMDFWTPSANLCCLSANFKNFLTTPPSVRTSYMEAPFGVCLRGGDIYFFVHRPSRESVVRKVSALLWAAYRVLHSTVNV